MPNWVQIAHFPQKRFVGKIDCNYCLPTVFFDATTLWLLNFGPNWMRVNSFKGDILEKLTNLINLSYPIMLKWFKRSSVSDHEI